MFINLKVLLLKYKLKYNIEMSDQINNQKDQKVTLAENADLTEKLEVK